MGDQYDHVQKVVLDDMWHLEKIPASAIAWEIPVFELSFQTWGVGGGGGGSQQGNMPKRRAIIFLVQHVDLEASSELLL